MPKVNLTKLVNSQKSSNSHQSPAVKHHKQTSMSHFFTPKTKSKTNDVVKGADIPLDKPKQSAADGSGTSNSKPKVAKMSSDKKRSVSPADMERKNTKKQKLQAQDLQSSSPLLSKTQQRLSNFQSPSLTQTSSSKSSSTKTCTDDQKTTQPTKKEPTKNRTSSAKPANESTPADSKTKKGFNPKEKPGASSDMRKKTSDRPGKSIPSHVGGAAIKYTPLEQQVVDLKAQYPNTLLFVECGYRYRFFGQDAQIAANELNIFCHQDHNFLVASVPVHRLFVHAKRLVAKGHKVGVVKQTETAALKAAGDNKSAPFARKLTTLYTKSTLVGEDVDTFGPDDDSGDVSCVTTATNYLLCLGEFTKPGGTPRRTGKMEYGLVAIQPATGDIIYDCFHDNNHCSELDTRIHHIQPVELLLPIKLSKRTEKLVQDIVSSSASDDDRLRIERMDNEHFDYSKALEVLASFYKDDEDKTNKQGRQLQEIINLPIPVICCLAALLTYLKEFNLHRVLKMTSNLACFTSKSQSMKLNACALRNLEIFKNQTNGSLRGSLFWVLDQTKTQFGSRILRKWLAMPLMNLSDIKERQDAVEELLHSNCEVLTQAGDLLAKIPDLERSICSIYHKKCSTAEFYSVVKSLSKLFHAFSSFKRLAADNLTSDLLKTIFIETPSLLKDVDSFLQAVNEKAAKEKKKTELFVDVSGYPGVVECRRNISSVEKEIHDHLKQIRRILKNDALNYVTISGIEFLIDIKNSLVKNVPDDWMKISSTKQASRFHPPFVVKSYKKLAQLRERLAIECQTAWLQFLESFGERYFAYRQAVQHLARLDCLFALAKLASQEGFCRPVLSDDAPASIHIQSGRHPVITTLLGEQQQYVPNNTHLQGSSGQRCMIITGPNMGGKTSYIRQVALITIMAQLGSWVPAKSARIGVVDAIYTRMGASDNIYQRRSTFMVELQEASDILRQATDRSLVILDELGRGTSTHDGVAIAQATADYFLHEIKCLLLFVTHYPSLAGLERLHPDHVANHHMSFLLHEDKDDEPQQPSVDVITFLYQLVPGVAAKSYGLNVARLANIPTCIIKSAAVKSAELEKVVDLARVNRELFIKLWTCEPADTRQVLQSLTAKSVE